MKILVRLPNWLGDMVMSAGFMHQLEQCYPGAEISVIAKKGIHELLHYFPQIKHRFLFDKSVYNGFRGLRKFGDEIRQREKFDLFFSLPNSFSAALIGYASGADKRVGYNKEMRQIFLTHHYQKPENLHRVEEYIRLLELFTGKESGPRSVRLNHDFGKAGHVVVNINSEASSRRLTVIKAVELLQTLRKNIDNRIVLTGAPKEREFVDLVISHLPDKTNLENLAGQTGMCQLVETLASAQLMLSTDSGPAHLANALGTQTIVLFGAGNEKHTAPYNEEQNLVIRLGQLSCEPCEKNICVRFGTPQCLERLNSEMIVENVKLHLH